MISNGEEAFGCLGTLPVSNSQINPRFPEIITKKPVFPKYRQNQPIKLSQNQVINSFASGRFLQIFVTSWAIDASLEEAIRQKEFLPSI